MPRRDLRNRFIPYSDLSALTGLELGPLHDPVVLKSEGHILYADHASTEELKAKYRHNPGVPDGAIVDIDVIWDNNGASSIRDHSLDYVIASHVIEHVPNLLGWLEHVHRVLKPDGILGLAVPDKRFTFDYKRRETTIADIVNAWLVGATSPLPSCLLDHFFNAAHIDLAAAWDTNIEADTLALAHAPEFAIQAASEVLHSGTYMDCHCWVFTPRSMAQLFERAAEIGVVHFKCVSFRDTEYYNAEFFVQLSPCEDREAAARSWRSMADAALDHREDLARTSHQRGAVQRA